MENNKAKLEEAINVLSSVKLSELPDDQRERVVNLVSRTDLLPKKWSRTTNAPYYREHFAYELKLILDEWEKDPDKDLKFLCRKFRATKLTLVQRVNQAWLYIIDHMDDSGHYKELRKKVEVLRESDGVRLLWKRFYQPDWTPDKVAKLEYNYKWKMELHDFLETAVGEETLKLTGLRLQDSDMKYVRELIDKLPFFYILSVSPSVIHIARMETPESNDDRGDIADVS